MAVYIVTGKLGSGKTLLACMKAQEYLKRRSPIASNIEFNLESLCRPTNDYSRFVRLPDMPTSDDLINLGLGCQKYDEERFGAIFLDEAGIWLNSRKWNSSGRLDLLEFFLYLRKRRWDLWLMVQNIDVVDKQIRASIAEHVVYCSRTDRYQMPIIPKLILNVVTVGLINFIKMPKFHIAVAKYGVSKLAPASDTWYYKGDEFYKAYNTDQQFNADYDRGCYSVLPPKYTLPIRVKKLKVYSEYLKTLPSHTVNKSTLQKKIMKLTKIYFRKFRVFTAFGSGAFVSFVFSLLVYNLFISDTLHAAAAVDVQSKSDLKPQNDSGFSLSSDLINNPFKAGNEAFVVNDKTIETAVIYAFSRFPNGDTFYKFRLKNGAVFPSSDLPAFGYQLIKGDRYNAQLQNENGDTFTIRRAF